MDGNNYTNRIFVEQVRECIECTRCRKYAKLYGFMCAVMLLEVAMLAYVFSINDDLHHKFEVSCILAAMFGSAFVVAMSQIIWNVIRLRAVERGVGVLPVYKVVFENVVTNAWTGTKFAVEIPDGSGVTVKTRPTFVQNKPTVLTKSRTFIPTLYVEDFKGKEVLVMYNPNRKQIYVLDFADNFTLPTDTF